MKINKTVWALALLVSCVILSFGCPAGASVITSRLKGTLKTLPSGSEVSVIVTLKEQADVWSMDRQLRHFTRRERRRTLIENLKNVAETSQASLRTLVKNRNARMVLPLWIINGIALTAPASVIRELAIQPEVGTIDLDAVISMVPPQPALEAASEWNISMVHAPDLWSMGYTGQNVVVANMDTGVDINHPDLSSKWRGGSNSWYDPYGQHSTPYDYYGHGTATMGIMVGGSAGGSNIGVAPDAKWIAVKIFSDENSAMTSAIHAGFQWLLNPDGDPNTDDAPDIVNNSWGFKSMTNICSVGFEADVQALKTAGIAVVFSAGNDGPNDQTSSSPANYPESFAVGSVNSDKSASSFSSRGPSACHGRIYPDVAAPGGNIKVAYLTSNGTNPYSYAYWSGTSFSAPHVAGVMALLMSAAPSASVSQLEEALKASAEDLGTSGPDNVYGYGLINAANALYAVIETVSQPDAPVISTSSGIFKGTPGTSYTFTTGGSVSGGGNDVRYLFDWGDGTNSGWLPVGQTSASKTWSSVGTYAVRARAVSSAYSNILSEWSASVSMKISNPVTLTIISSGSYDGSVLESANSSGVGGSAYASISLGDDKANRGRKGILSFNTSKIPVAALVLSAKIKLTRSGVTGTNPFTVLGACYVDVKKGTFNRVVREAVDFQVAATVTQAATLSNPAANKGTATAFLNADGLNAINGGGTTQVRLYFASSTNNNSRADTLSFYSNNFFIPPAWKPALTVTYLP